MHIMSKLALLAAGVFVAGAATATHLVLNNESDTPNNAARVSAEAVDTPAYVPAILKTPATAPAADVDKLFDDAARAAWSSLNSGYVPATGLIMAQPEWPYPTVWDIASTIAAYYSARGLGYIPDAEYQKRTKLLLETMKKADLYDGIAFGRNYDARTGKLVGAGHEAAGNGTGYSAIDLGRLLIWLKIVANHDPQLAQLANDVVQRLNKGRIIRGGYMFGETLPKQGKLMTYQEGRIGYEQYSAAGFQLWNFKADRAASVTTNARLVKVGSVPVFADRRNLDRLTSEPVILHGLEVGFQGKMVDLAWQTLALQAQRYNQTKKVTIVSEDAIALAPDYFYYYCVFCNGKPFVINVHEVGKNLDAPRWVSTKAAFAWYALFPNDYTWLGVQAVQPARDAGKGWATGVYESNGKTTNTFALNTSAVIMEAALYRKTGKAFLN